MISKRLLGVAALVVVCVWLNRGKAEDAEQVDVKRSYVVVHVAKGGRLGHEHAVLGKLSSGEVRLGAKEEAGQLVFDTNYVCGRRRQSATLPEA